MQFRLFLILLLSLAMAEGAPIAVLAKPADTASAPTALLAAQLADRGEGDPKAPVTIIEYSSLTCPHCAEFNETTLPQLKADYIDTGKVYYISRDFPLDGVALKAAMMARCAPPENYFQLIDLLFKSQNSWERAPDPATAISPLGRLAGMSEADVKTCLANDALEKGIVAERSEAEKIYNIEATPSFVFNNGAVTLSGADPYDKFKSTIGAMIAKK